MLGRRIAARQSPPTCLSELRRALLDEWCNILQDQIDNLILSMPRRCDGFCPPNMRHLIGDRSTLTVSPTKVSNNLRTEVIILIQCGHVTGHWIHRSRVLSSGYAPPQTSPYRTHIVDEFLEGEDIPSMG
ncbi:transposable element Tcb1 transposase [Trichonephila clavipes]|nr:transposable element Tcb1 transposase [Trichonephila clavipes]